MEIKKVTEKDFRKYGKIVEGIDFNPILKMLDALTCPEEVEYVASYHPMEDRQSGTESGTTVLERWGLRLDTASDIITS